MIWLTWRQFRAQILVTAGALGALAAYMVVLGMSIRDFYDTEIATCTGDACRLALTQMQNDYADQLSILGALLIAVPAVIGIFWGAPLVTRELEERTDRLVWNQSVTRTRWLAVKLGVIALFTILVTGLFSLLLTWSASRFDQVIGERFAALTFDSRNLVPAGYGLFAFVLGTVIGMVVRRTLPTMAITLAIFAALQILVPTLVRQNLMPPVTETVTLDAAAFDRQVGISLTDNGLFVSGYTVPEGWALTDQAQLYNPDGSPYTDDQARQCIAAGDFEASQQCTIAQKLTFEHTYQPGNRYWPFQWIELSIFVGLSVLLAGFGFWWLRRRV